MASECKHKPKEHQLSYQQPEIGGMKINAMPPWAQPQKGNPSLPSHIKDSMGHAPYASKGKRFGLARKSQVTVMFVGAKKDALVDTSSPFESQP